MNILTSTSSEKFRSIRRVGAFGVNCGSSHIAKELSATYGFERLRTPFEWVRDYYPDRVASVLQTDRKVTPLTHGTGRDYYDKYGCDHLHLIDFGKENDIISYEKEVESRVSSVKRILSEDPAHTLMIVNSYTLNAGEVSILNDFANAGALVWVWFCCKGYYPDPKENFIFTHISEEEMDWLINHLANMKKLVRDFSIRLYYGDN